MFQTLVKALEASIGYTINLQERIHWFYILTSILLAVYVYWRTQSRVPNVQHSKGNTIKNFLAFLFKKEHYWSKTAFTDYAFLLFNGFFKVLFLSWVLLWVTRQQNNLNEWFLEHVGYKTIELDIPVLLVIYPLFILIIGDFSYYLLHLLYHKIPFLWAFHKIHHSSTALNPITQFRIHPIELVLNNMRYALVLILLGGTFNYLAGGGVFYQKTFMGVNLVLFAFNTWGANLRHSHIKLVYFNWLESWLISPYQHQIHHSAQKHLHDKNLGSKLAIWDKMFGTLVKSKEVDDLIVGLGEEDRHYNTFFKSLIRPFSRFFLRSK